MLSEPTSELPIYLGALREELPASTVCAFRCGWPLWMGVEAPQPAPIARDGESGTFVYEPSEANSSERQVHRAGLNTGGLANEGADDSHRPASRGWERSATFGNGHAVGLHARVAFGSGGSARTCLGLGDGSLGLAVEEVSFHRASSGWGRLHDPDSGASAVSSNHTIAAHGVGEGGEGWAGGR